MPPLLRQLMLILAILIGMSVPEQMPLADVKNRLKRAHGRVIITSYRPGLSA